MKKLLLIAFAATAIITGCSKDEIVKEATPTAIGFSEAFIDNSISARTNDPSYTLDGENGTVVLDAFDVYGFNNKYTAMLFDGDVVSGGNGNWTYTPIRYWRKGLYSFVAIAPSSDKHITVEKAPVLNAEVNTPEKLIKAIKFSNTTGTKDLIMATAIVDNTTTVNDAPVAFTFKHLLSKIKFNVTNGYPEGPENVIKVKSATITAPFEGAYDTGTGTWNSSPSVGDYIFGETVELNGGESADCGFEKLFIPKKNGVYKVSFIAELTFNGVTNSFHHVIEDVILTDFEPGNSYNIKITLNNENINPDVVMKPIVFNVTAINSWTPTGGTDVNFDPAAP